MVVTAPDSLPCIGMHYQTHTFPLANLTQVVIIIYRCVSISLWYSYCRTGFRICQPINDRVHLLHKNEDLIKGTRLSLTRGRCQHAARTRSNIPECQDGMSLHCQRVAGKGDLSFCTHSELSKFSHFYTSSFALGNCYNI